MKMATSLFLTLMYQFSKEDLILTDWGSIALVCPCKNLKDIHEIKDLNGKGFKMDTSKPRQVNFICQDCLNKFDYEVKIRLFELLEKFYESHKSFEGFSGYVTRKGQRIRLKYIKTLKLKSDFTEKDIIIIEAANLTTHPSFKGRV